MSAATEADVIARFQVLADSGPSSTGTLAVVGDPGSGDALVIKDRAAEATLLTLTAITSGTPGANEFLVVAGNNAATATNIAAAFTDSGLFTARTTGAGVYVTTTAHGYASMYAVSSTGANMVWVETSLSGGDALLAMAVSIAAQSLNITAWGGRYFWATLLYAAHIVAYLSGSGGSGSSAGSVGVVASRTIGQISASYAVTAADTSDAALGQTIYGQQYLAMRNSLAPFRMGIVGRGTLQRLGS